MKNTISQEIIEQFLNGIDPEKHIVGLEYDYPTNSVYKIIQDPEKGKQLKIDKFVPFIWVKDLSGLNFYNNSKTEQRKKIGEHGIIIDKLDTHDNLRLKNGYRYLVKSLKGYTQLIHFFKEGGIDIWNEKFKSYFIALNPLEQYLIQTKKRLFKGYEEYDDVHRFVFDIETTGLDPNIHRIFMIGMKDNKGFKKLVACENDEEERLAIIEFFNSIDNIKPTIIGGYNSAFFDFPFILRRAELLGLDIKKIAKTINPDSPLRQRDGVLKIGGEVENIKQTSMWGYDIIDIAHAVRRAQGINSDIQSWSLKYITKFIDAAKPNRVYVKGDEIGKTYFENKTYYFNPITGGYKMINEPGTEKLMERYPGKFEVKTGKYLVENYLDDDLYETMVVDSEYNQSNFLLTKLVPTTFERIATMGTAALWKIIMCAWSYENNLAIPEKSERRQFTGGLSKLIQVGYSTDVLKLDYSSLYPSIQLVHDVFPECDVTGVMKSMLKYFRDTRIKFKKLAEQYYDSNIDLASKYSRKQLPIKIFINSFFGSLSAPLVFPWADIDQGEMITCTGRQYLRQMIMWFKARGYEPLVMDSVTYDTPVYLKDKNNNFIILPICDLFNDKSEIMSNDKLRDFSEKDYQILTKSGWKNIRYVYKHSSNKNIHKLVTKDRLIECTSDHSVYQDGEQIKPTELKCGDKIDIYDLPYNKREKTLSVNKARLIGFFIGDSFSNYDSNKINNTRKSNARLYEWFSKNCYTSYKEKMIPLEILNGTKEIKKSFMEGFYLADNCGNDFNKPLDIIQKSKVCLAGLSYILKDLGINYKISTRKDKPKIQSLIMGNFNDSKSNRKNNEIWTNEIQENKENKEKFVYDISTMDGTFIGGIGGLVLKNTDGVNFATPKERYKYHYTGKGLNDLTEKDKVYEGPAADVAEYNDLFMIGEMGLDIDGVWPATINIARKNYALLTPKGKIKKTGNSIKSKKMPTYIANFLEHGLDLLLANKGKEFIEYYYEYIRRIYNKEIPLSEIANKGRVKQTVSEYKKYITRRTKAGSLMSRQAHMELIMLNEVNAGLGDTIYYVNNGEKKSHGDVQKKNIWYATAKEKREYLAINGEKMPPDEIEIKINCYMIPEADILKNPEKCGEYNVARYLAAFNKRIEPLLVVFNPDIRNTILVENPEDEAFFTEKQTQLVRGFPMKNDSQDDLNDVLVMTNSEIKFWKKVNKSPYYMYPENTIELVDLNMVSKNMKVMNEYIEEEIKE